jgi:hypothetical protein
MRLLVDGDILRYELGAICQTVDEVFGVPVVVPHSLDRVKETIDWRLEQIMDATDSDTFEVFLSAGSNYRYDIAKTHVYKGQRDKSFKPVHWKTIGEIIMEDHGGWMVHGAEADDALSIFAREDPENTVIASRDKDLRIIPCWHYAWKCGEKQPEVPIHKIDELGYVAAAKYPSGGYKLIGEGLRFFYGQILAGDDIDNYKGCPSIGPQKAASILAGCNTEIELWEAAYWAFTAKLGPEAGYERLIEQARLAWLLSEAEVTYDDHNIHVSPSSLWNPPASIPTSVGSRDSSIEPVPQRWGPTPEELHP